MNVSKNARPSGLSAFVPFVFGIMALGCCAVYCMQRSGLLFLAFSQAVQRHLDELAGGALLAGVLGGLSGVVILQLAGRNRMVVFGTLISSVALFWSLVLPL